jgi:hypothetical protein
MLGKQHILVTSFFLIAYLAIIIFSYFNTTSVSASNILSVASVIVYKNYILFLLFSIGVLISATAPDIDISSNIKGVKVWNKLTRVGYLLLTSIMRIFLPKKNFEHRHIYHSFVGMAMYSLIILVVSFCFFGGYVLLFSFISNHVVNVYLLKTAYSVFLLKLQYVEIFIIGCAVGFFSHLLEDSITVSGIDYFPGITKKRLAGKFITVGKNGIYKSRDGSTIKVGYFKRSQFGAWLSIVYVFIFLSMFFYFSIYLTGLVFSSVIFLIGLLLYDFVFCGLKIKPY